MDDVAVLLEHIDLLDSLDRLDIELLQRRLQLLVIHSRALVHLLDLSSGCALSTIAGLSAFLQLSPAIPNTAIVSKRPRWSWLRKAVDGGYDTYPRYRVS